jgi:hypothetical protein
MGIHLSFNRRIIRLQIFNDLFFHGPTKEVQFPHRRHELFRPWQAEHNPLTPAEGVKKFLTVGFELILITIIDHELLAL